MNNTAAAVIPFPTAQAEPKYLDSPEVAKLAKKVLSKAFPGVKFSCTSDRYAGGSSVDIRWTDGPTARQVDAIVGSWHGYDFDGMTDSTIVRGPQEVPGLGRCRFGNGYIHTSRTLSDDFRARLDAWVTRKYHESCWQGGRWEKENFIYRISCRATLVGSTLLVAKDQSY